MYWQNWRNEMTDPDLIKMLELIFKDIHTITWIIQWTFGFSITIFILYIFGSVLKDKERTKQ